MAVLLMQYGTHELQMNLYFSDHIEKGFNDLNALTKLVNEGKLNDSDRDIANTIISDLKDALKGLESPN